MITIKAIQYSEVLRDENAALVDEYGAECSITAIGPINPQLEIYDAMERAGVTRCYGVFCDGKMIGFANIFMTVMPHYGQKLATVESLFVSAPYRNTRAGMALMKVIEGYMRGVGCVGVLYSAPAGGKFEQLLSRRRAYQRTNAVFYRGLN